MTADGAGAMTVESHFNLRRSPFERDIPAGALYMSPKTMELLSMLEYAVRRRKFVVFQGKSGTAGASLLGKHYICSWLYCSYNL